jgi:hypothetical protein
MSLQTIFAADAHLAEGQVMREEPTVNRGNLLNLLFMLMMLFFWV